MIGDVDKSYKVLITVEQSPLLQYNQEEICGLITILTTAGSTLVLSIHSSLLIFRTRTIVVSNLVIYPKFTKIARIQKLHSKLSLAAPHLSYAFLLKCLHL